MCAFATAAVADIFGAAVPAPPLDAVRVRLGGMAVALTEAILQWEFASTGAQRAASGGIEALGRRADGAATRRVCGAVADGRTFAGTFAREADEAAGRASSAPVPLRPPASWRSFLVDFDLPNVYVHAVRTPGWRHAQSVGWLTPVAAARARFLRPAVAPCAGE